MAINLGRIREIHNKRVVDSWSPPRATLPELTEAEAFEVLERIIEAEKRLVAPNMKTSDYAKGTATVIDELYTTDGMGTLLSAEHATNHHRVVAAQPKIKEADYGTAGLGQVLHEDVGAALVLPRGQQSGDAARDIHHPLKDVLTREIQSEHFNAHISLHGALTGLYQDFNDVRGIDIHLGIGSTPSEETTLLAQRLERIARNLGLTAITNGLFVVNKSFNPLEPHWDEDGTPRRRSFAAKNPGTTRAHVQTIAERKGLEIATVQVEMSGFLRLQPEDDEPRDRVARAIGVYLGYQVLSETITSHD